MNARPNAARKPTRYILEGEWSGYTSAQRHITHREVIRAKRAEKMVLRTIQYTDGTLLYLTLRPATPREKVQEKLGYGSLIRDAEAKGKSFVRVADLGDDEVAA